MSLRPERGVHKLLISSTSRFVGEFERPDLLLTHAWPIFGTKQRQAKNARNAFVFALRTEPVVPRPGAPEPNYAPIGELICSYLAVLFGKRFDSHGIVETIGLFGLPDLQMLGQAVDSSLPQNSEAVRPDFAIPLQLGETARLAPLLFDDTVDPKASNTFRGAAKFYLQALQTAEHDPEVAYLHLVTAGEILSSFYEYTPDEVLDEAGKRLLADLRALPDGERLAKQVAARMFSVKRCFVKTILDLVAQDFFDRSEASVEYGRFKAETFERCISAAYDIRSRYVHTGVPFGDWITLRLGGICEVMVGKPVLGDKELEKILAKAPTYVGLERVMRYCLLRFATKFGLCVEAIDPATVIGS